MHWAGWTLYPLISSSWILYLALWILIKAGQWQVFYYLTWSNYLVLPIEVHVFSELICFKRNMFQKWTEQRKKSERPLMNIKVPNLDLSWVGLGPSLYTGGLGSMVDNIKIFLRKQFWICSRIGQINKQGSKGLHCRPWFWQF